MPKPRLKQLPSSTRRLRSVFVNPGASRAEFLGNEYSGAVISEWLSRCQCQIPGVARKLPRVCASFPDPAILSRSQASQYTRQPSSTSVCEHLMHAVGLYERLMGDLNRFLAVCIFLTWVNANIDRPKIHASRSIALDHKTQTLLFLAVPGSIVLFKSRFFPEVHVSLKGFELP